MADGSSSPLSSPPASSQPLIELGSPARSTEGAYDLAGRQEGTPEAVEESRGRPARRATKDDEAEGPEPIVHGSDEGGNSGSQKRRASTAIKLVPSKKPRRALPGNKKSAQDKKWETPFVYTDSRSPLAQADLRVRTPHPLLARYPITDTIFRQFCCFRKLGTS
jgi:hypothetical protein